MKPNEIKEGRVYQGRYPSGNVRHKVVHIFTKDHSKIEPATEGKLLYYLNTNNFNAYLCTVEDFAAWAELEVKR